MSKESSSGNESVNFPEIPLLEASIEDVLGPVAECGEFYVQAVRGNWIHSGRAVTSMGLGNALLSDRWNPPAKLGKSVNDESTICSAWIGGRIRHLFIDGELPACDGETFLDIGFCFTFRADPTHGWYVGYADSQSYPELWFGIEGYSIPDEETQKAIEQALFELLISRPTELRDYQDSHEYGTFGVRNGVPFYE